MREAVAGQVKDANLIGPGASPAPLQGIVLRPVGLTSYLFCEQLGIESTSPLTTPLECRVHQGSFFHKGNVMKRTSLCIALAALALAACDNRPATAPPTVVTPPPTTVVTPAPSTPPADAAAASKAAEDAKDAAKDANKDSTAAKAAADKAADAANDTAKKK
jgi:hypothetical protein